MELLETQGLSKAFGELRAVNGVSLGLREGVLTSIIGPNGAGKTTLLNLLTGKLLPDAGRIFFKGEEITRLPASARVQRGLGRSFQITNIFPRLSVLENVTVPVLASLGQSLSAWRDVRGLTAAQERARAILRDVGLLDRQQVPAGTLSYGDQRLLEIGLALATQPQLLFLDEPTAGLNPVERVNILANIRRLSQHQRVTFLIVEHDMDVVFALSDRIVVMHRGEVFADGNPEVIQGHRGVRDIYLGEDVLAQPGRPRPGPAAAPPLLEVEAINTFYGQSHILHDVSLRVAAGEVVCLLGRNGVGKTTTLRSIMGLTPPRSGRIAFKGLELTGLPAHQIARLGIGYVPDDRRIFPDLTVRRNLEIAARASGRPGPWDVDRIYELFPPLRELDARPGRHLSGGEQKMLAIGRALMGNPELLILDEPSEGLSPLIVQSLAGAIARIRQQGVTILIADQNLKFAAGIADRGYILEKGVVQHGGAMADLWADEALVKRYLAV